MHFWPSMIRHQRYRHLPLQSLRRAGCEWSWPPCPIIHQPNESMPAWIALTSAFPTDCRSEAEIPPSGAARLTSERKIDLYPHGSELRFAHWTLIHYPLPVSLHSYNIWVFVDWCFRFQNANLHWMSTVVCNLQLIKFENICKISQRTESTYSWKEFNVQPVIDRLAWL